MYVCVCKGVTDKQIVREVQDGATTFQELQERLEVGLCCGQCKEQSVEIIENVAMSYLALAI